MLDHWKRVPKVGVARNLFKLSIQVYCGIVFVWIFVQVAELLNCWQSSTIKNRFWRLLQFETSLFFWFFKYILRRIERWGSGDDRGTLAHIRRITWIKTRCRRVIALLKFYVSLCFSFFNNHFKRVVFILLFWCRRLEWETFVVFWPTIALFFGALLIFWRTLAQIVKPRKHKIRNKFRFYWNAAEWFHSDWLNWI